MSNYPNRSVSAPPKRPSIALPKGTVIYGADSPYTLAVKQFGRIARQTGVSLQVSSQPLPTPIAASKRLTNAEWLRLAQEKDWSIH